jgi:uncharacterized protein (DUF1778 family)
MTAKEWWRLAIKFDPYIRKERGTRHVIYVSLRDYEAIMKAIENPAEPNEALRKAFQRYRNIR